MNACDSEPIFLSSVAITDYESVCDWGGTVRWSGGGRRERWKGGDEALRRVRHDNYADSTVYSLFQLFIHDQ